MAGSSDAQALLLTISADTSKAVKALDAFNAKLTGLAPQFERKAKAAAEAAEKGFTGEGFSKAFGKVFDSSKLAVLEEGSAKIRIFGSALEPLGPLGISAAAGIAALGVSLEEAHKAVEFADNLFKLAKNAHVTTDELQQFQFALRVSGGNAADASGALQSFSAMLGKAQAGLPKAQRAFLELGFSKEQIKGFSDAGTALIDVTAKIAALKSPAQKDAVIEQLGLENMKPLIEGGTEKMRDFMAEAQAAGQVMDASLVKRGHELNEQLETLHTKIDVQLKTAFIELGPVLVTLAGLMADMATFARQIEDSFRGIGAKSDAGLIEERKKLTLQASAPLAGALGIRSDNQARIAEIDAEIARRKADNKPAALPTGGGSLTDVSHHTKPRDDTAQRSAEVAAALDGVEKQLLEAWGRLIIGADQQAEIQKQIVDVEQKQLGDRLDKQEADIRADKGLSKAKKDDLVASLEIVRGEQAKVADLQKELIDRERDERKRQDALKVTESGLDLQAQLLSIQESLAVTAKERRDIELRLLDLADKRLEAEFDAVIASKTASDADKQIAQAKLDQLRNTRGQREDVVKAQTRGPAEQFIFDSTNAKKSAENFERIAVSAFDSLSSGLADAIVNAHSLGDVAKNVFRQMVADLLAAAIKKDIAAPLLAVFGFAGGGPVHGPGSSTSDSIPAMLSNGEFVVKADAARKHPALLEALNSGRMPHLAEGGWAVPQLPALTALKALNVTNVAPPVSVFQSVMFDLKGSVVTDDLRREMAAMSERSRRMAVQEATRVGREGLPGRLQTLQKLGS